jgi:hypothetical protein
MKDDDKGTYFQQADWLQYWTTAMLDWQRAYSWAMDGLVQRAEQMGGMRGGPAWSSEDLTRMYSRMMETWTSGMGAMPGAQSGIPGASGQQAITGCAAQAYFATMTNLLRWWMRVAQSWSEYGRNAAARSGTAMQDGSTLGVFADETRAQMRKVVDISLEECALLQRQMEELGDRIRNIVDGVGPDADPRRWARAKE